MRRIARAGVLVAACAVTAAVVLLWTREARDGSGTAAAAVAPLADSYLRDARERGDEKALDEVQKADQDPWVLAEELLLLGRRDAAARVARAHLAEDEAVLT